jgi:hypothetical protein
MEVVFLNLGNQITKIGGLAFYGCKKLESVDPLLPASLVSLGDGAFYGCESLTGDVVFPANEISLTSVWNNNAVGWFYNTRITSCDMSKTKTLRTVSGVKCNMIVNHAFNSCKALKRVKLSTELDQIDGFAFQNASALTVVEPFLPESLTLIGSSAFSGCSSLEGDLVINGSKLVTFRKNDNNGDLSNFYSTKIRSAKLLSPIEGISQIGTVGSATGTFPTYLFNSCKSLESLEIGKDVTSISSYALKSCTALKDVKFFGPVPQFAATSFQDVTDKKIRFHVSKADVTWQTFRADNVIAMNDALCAEWDSLYPNETRPKGQFTLSSKKMWYCPDFGAGGIVFLLR